MEFQQRLKTLQEKLSKKEFGGVLITASPDLYYLTGKNMSSGKLLVFQPRHELPDSCAELLLAGLRSRPQQRARIHDFLNNRRII